MDIKFDQKTYDISFDLRDDFEADLIIIKDPTEILMQRLFLRFKTFPRDLFWNINYGIDYLNDVFGINKPKSSVDAIIRNEILKEEMVQKLDLFESEIVNYRYACKFSVKLKYEPKVVTFFVLTNESGLILTNESGDVLTSQF